ncbi:restriction endonuclease subunit S [Streptosporangium vulgare]|uniref:Restriction endonuclease subunit S n=1 Tax=Streptosporangium vulgare TaxID=46190 RepID=A0ABV5TF73_9ACTN
MVSSLIGELPDGWTEVRLEEICELKAGVSTPADSGGPVAVMKPRNIADDRFTGIPDGIGEEAAAKLPSYRLMAGDVVCVRTGGIGKHALVTAEQEGWVIGTGIIRLRPGPWVDPPYLSHYLSHPSVQNWFARNGSGTAVPNISTRVLGALPVVLAPLPVQHSIGKTLGALNEKIATHERICRTTAQLRDTLLPLLMSGTSAAQGPGRSGG